MKTAYEYIVLGCGGIGGGALYWLARRARQDILGLEQFPLFHHNGGSQDYSRVIRLYYHQDSYAQLTPHAYDCWATVSAEAGLPVVTQTGGLMMADAESDYATTVRNYAHSLDAAGIPYEWLDNDELRYRYPQFCYDGDLLTFYQARTGIADPSRGNACHLSLARGYGATVLDECTVQVVTPRATDILLETSQGTFTCRKLVIAAGAWSQALLATVGMRIPTRVSQEQVTYYATPHLKAFAVGNFPVWQWKDDYGYYGFPVYGEVATKASIDDSGAEVTAASRTFEPDTAREAQLRSFIEARIPNFVGPTLYTKTCLYTMPPDRNFILDHLPSYPNIFMAVGAGHGYKFASLLGKILSELAIDGATDHNIVPFLLTRPAIADPNYVSTLRY